MRTSRLKTNSRNAIVPKLNPRNTGLETLLPTRRYQNMIMLKWKIRYTTVMLLCWWDWWDTLIEAQQVGYGAFNEEVNAYSIYLEKELIVDIIQPGGYMDSLLIRNIESFIKSDWSRYELTRRVARCQLLIAPMTGHVERFLNKIEDEHHLGQWLEEQILGFN